MADIKKLNEAAFKTEVVQSTIPVMVDFTATWCGPCKMLEPVITQLSQDWDGKVKFVKLDVDDNSNLAVQYGVMGVPTLILFVNGDPVQRRVGTSPKTALFRNLALTSNPTLTYFLFKADLRSALNFLSAI